ncbi:hypothetical protein ABTM88_18910, partial [Acinetobacter baumannii]
MTLQQVVTHIGRIAFRAGLAFIVVLTQVQCMGQGAGGPAIDRDFQPVTSGNGRAITYGRASSLTDPRAHQIFGRAESPIFNGSEV